MSITRGNIKDEALRFLNKSASYKGMATEDKLNDAVQEAVDFAISQMAIAGMGWLMLQTTLTMPGTGNTADLPTSVFMIKDLRYKQNDIYIPLLYDGSSLKTTYTSTSAITSFPMTYALLNDNKIWFNPAPTERGANMIQIDYIGYPTRFTLDANTLPKELEVPFSHYIVHRVASRICTTVGNPSPAWAQAEAQWWATIQQLIAKRVNAPNYIKEFEV